MAPNGVAHDPAITSKLRGLLEQNDPEAAGLLETNGAALCAALGERFDEVRQALEKFDFEAALVLLGPGSAGEPQLKDFPQ